MADPTSDEILDAALHILLHERSLFVTFGAGSGVSIKFPATRSIAEFAGLPHYLVLRSCARMEEDGLVTKAERAGIVTTQAGSRAMIGLMQEKYRTDSEGILGTAIFQELVQKTQ